MEDLGRSDKKPTIPTAKKVVYVSFLIDISDIILSVVVATTTGSIVMFTEALEGVADLVASGLLVIGTIRSGIPADRRFPFGYGKELYFWTFISAAVIMGITSTLSIYFGWQRFTHPQQLHGLNAAYGVLILTMLTNGYAFLLSMRRLKGKSHSNDMLSIFFRSSLIDTKTAFVLDFAGTVASFLGFSSLVLYQITGDQRFDGIGAISVGFVLIFLGFLLILGIRDLLIGQGASDKTLNKIRKISLSIPEVRDVKDVRTMHIGSERLLVNMDVTMEKDLTTYEIAKLIGEIKAKIKAEIPSIKNIHLELELPS